MENIMPIENERKLTPIEEAVLSGIEERPGLTAEDYAAGYNHDPLAYNAIYYLVFHLYVDRDPRTSALTARPR